MTSTEKPRNLTAKEIAEQALERAAEASTTAATVLAELRELRESGTTGGSVDPNVTERLNNLDKDIEGLLENLNQVSQMKATGGVDLEPLRAEIKAGFDAYKTSLDQHGTALAHVKEDTEKSLARLASEVGELAGWIKAFDEAGVAPASAEEVSSLDGRLRTLEQYYMGTSDVTAGAAPRPANSGQGARQVIDMHGDVVPAIHGQVWQLMKLVGSLGKDSQADRSMGGYKFRSIEAAMTAVGHALREVGVMFVPGEILDKRIERYSTQGHEFKNGQRYEKTLNWTHVWVTQRYYFVSLIDGSTSMPFEMDGEARDNGDKSTSKADSMRMKYALLQALCIPTEGLPESDGRDGTEGADWGSAPPVGSGQGQQHRDELPREDEGHDGAPQGTMPDQAPADDRPDNVKAAAAYGAIQRLMQIPVGQRRAEFTRIAEKIATERLGSLMHEGVSLNGHLTAANANLGA